MTFSKIIDIEEVETYDIYYIIIYVRFHKNEREFAIEFRQIISGVIISILMTA